MRKCINNTRGNPEATTNRFFQKKIFVKTKLCLSHAKHFPDVLRPNGQFLKLIERMLTSDGMLISASFVKRAPCVLRSVRYSCFLCCQLPSVDSPPRKQRRLFCPFFSLLLPCGPKSCIMLISSVMSVCRLCETLLSPVPTDKISDLNGALLHPYRL